MTESGANRLSSSPETDPATQRPIPTKPLVSQRTRRTTGIVSAIVVLVVLAILGGLGYLAYRSYDWVPEGVVPATVRLRDIAIVVMALETLVGMVLLLIAIVLLFVTVVLIYDRVIPILEQMNKTINTLADTAQTVRGTTTFVSEKVVSPVIEVSSYAAGLVRILRGIAELWPRSNRSDGQSK